MSLNQILLIGNAGRDAELSYTPNGTAVSNFSLAVNRRYQSRGEMREETEWFNVSAWDRQAETVANLVRRGRRVFVDGRLSTREYTNSSGESRTSLDVNANRVLILSPRDSDDEDAGNGYHQRDRYENGYQANNSNRAGYTAPAASYSDSPDSDAADDLENLAW